mmetsp:Transcript_74476/g.218144  ORF Transcript_74476/g.218144 Transcript_74476/m.218144 type:complete len:586 (+) Transcript_74476:237-1994(+)
MAPAAAACARARAKASLTGAISPSSPPPTPSASAAAAAALAAAAAPMLSRAASRRAARASRAAGTARRVATLDAKADASAGEKKYKIDLDGLVSLSKRRGFVFQSSEVYGGYSGFFDYGPLGVELKNNLKKVWWRRLVHGKDNIVGLDSSIVANPAVHIASGHVDNFSDPMVDCTESKKRFRADQLMYAKAELEDGTLIGYVAELDDASIEKVLKKQAKKLLKEAGKEGTLKKLEIKEYTDATEEEHPLIPSPATGKPGSLGPPRSFNLMFETQVGPYGDAASTSYLRPETAQGIFVNFKQVAEVSRLKVPFGIAQIGKAFRNEITPRQFIFRSREFEQMEIEYFIDPEADYEVEQEAWIVEMWNFLKAVGVDERLMAREVHVGDKLAHYARACTDIVFRYPFGQQELLGVAARGEYDLQQHSKASGKSMEYQVPGEKRKFVPHVIEPSLGVDRLFLAVLSSAYEEDEVSGEKRSFLKLEPCVAPITLGIFPLLKNKPEIVQKAKDMAAMLRRKGFNVFYDEAGSIGKRYRRMDEVGTPYCCTIDFDTIEKDGTVTIRDRDDPLKELPRMTPEEVAAFLFEATSI